MGAVLAGEALGKGGGGGGVKQMHSCQQQFDFSVRIYVITWKRVLSYAAWNAKRVYIASTWLPSESQQHVENVETQ